MSVSRVSNATAATAVAGLQMVTPTSVSVGSGTGSVAGQGAVTFSGASSVSLNGCFSANYENYRVIFKISRSVSDIGWVGVYLRSNGVDKTTSYFNKLIDTDLNAANVTWVGQNTTTALLPIGYTGSNIPLAGNFDVINPFVTGYTHFNGMGTGIVVGNRYQMAFFQGINTDSYSGDGLSFISSGGGFTGSIRVYGYNNGGA